MEQRATKAYALQRAIDITLPEIATHTTTGDKD